MKVCILSDSHDRGPLMAAAVAAAKAEGAAAVIHCGDIIGGNTLRASLKLGLPIHAVHGNNLGDPVSIARMAQAIILRGFSYFLSGLPAAQIS